MEDLTYWALHLPLLKLHKFNHPCEFLTLQQMAALVLSSVFGTSTAGRSEFKQSNVGAEWPGTLCWGGLR